MIRQSMQIVGVLVAALALCAGTAWAQQGSGKAPAKQVSGTVLRSRDIQVRTVVLQTQDGERLLVGLGPTQQLQDLAMQRGTSLQVQGSLVRIGEQPVLLARQVTVDGQTVQIAWPQQQMAQARQSMSQRQAGAQGEHPQVSTIRVTSASDIVGRAVRDAQGRRVGTVEYIMIDAQNGNVLYAMVGADGALNLDDKLLAVPWSSVDLTRQALQVKKSLDELKTAPQFAPEQLAELTQPTVVARVHDYYLVPNAPAEQQGPAPQAQQERQRPQSSQANQPRLLIGRSIVTTLLAPVLTSAQQIQGTQVENPDGQAVGTIDRVMIDPDHGHVAYVLLEKEQFLGMRGAWLPVPFEALRWSMRDQDYIVNASADVLQHAPALPHQALPTQVPAAQLQQLYADYGVTPYWERMAQAAEQPQARLASLAATVQDVNPQQGTVTLQTASGKTIDLQVSEELLHTLQEGDRVEVTIRQAPQGQQAEMPHTAPSAAEQGQ
jgi:sporulation protein YlmC with PRC-barrel domain/cold shock CspA family protein